MKIMQTMASCLLTTLVLSCSSPIADDLKDSSPNAAADPTCLREVLLDVDGSPISVISSTGWSEFFSGGWYGPTLYTDSEAFWSSGETSVRLSLGLNKIGTKEVVSGSANLSDLYVSVALSRLPVGETEISYAVYATHPDQTDGPEPIPATIGQVTLETNPYYQYPGNPYYGSDGWVIFDAPVEVSIRDTVLHRVAEHVLDSSVTWPESITIRSATFSRK